METLLTSTQPFPVGTLLWLASVVAIVGSFVYGARVVYRRWGMAGLVPLWLGAVGAYGYISFRLQCSRPAVCDVGPNPLSWNYLASVGAAYAVIAAAGFGVVGVLTVLHSRRSFPADTKRPALLTLIGGLAAWLLARVLLYSYAAAV